MHKDRLDSIKRQIRASSRFKRLKKSFQTLPQYKMPFDEYREELKRLHKMRGIGNLTVGDPNFVKHLAEAAVQDTSNRGRMTELLTQAVTVEKSLTRTLSVFEDFVLSEYATELKAISTKGEREKFVEALVRPYYNYLNDVNSFVAECRIYMEDIDKASFTVRHLVEAFAVIRKAEGKLSI